MQKLNRGLLFTEADIEYTSGIDTTTDLKLDMLLPEGTEDYLRARPTKEGLLKRREFFTRILSDRENAISHFRDLSQLLESAREAHEALGSAVCENAKHYVFAEFTARMIAAFRVAAQKADYGELYESFAAHFETALATEELTAISERLEAVGKAKENIGSLDLNADGDKIKITRERIPTMREKVLTCMEKYGIKAEPRESRTPAIQKGIIDAAATLYPAEFGVFTEFYRDFATSIDVSVFDCIPQLSLTVGIIELVEKAEKAGIPYCFPRLSEGKHIKLYDVYDIALLLKEGTKIIPNDAIFTEEEPFFYLTGANGGGKTTYLRAIGNAALLFSFGAPVFCRGGECCLLDSIHTHFPKDERFEGSGRFADEQKRVDEILKDTVDSERHGKSLILLNETYSTTNEEKATVCTSELARKLHASGNFGLYITHQHGVDEQTVPFLGVLVDEQDKNRRTYRIERRRLKNRSFAADILSKYGITQEGLKEKLLGN